MRALRFVRSAVVGITAIVAWTGSSEAQDRQRCIAASEKAQQLRIDGKLGEAREQLAICGRADCPKLVQTDCSQWMSEVLGMLPTVVPGARDRLGRDVVDARVSIDGKVVAESIDGKAVAVDPGLHAFRFETKGAPPVEEQVVVRQGEKNRLVTITFAMPATVTPVKPPPTTTAPPPKESSSALPILGLVIAGAGLAAGGVALGFGLDSNASARSARDECAPRCPPERIADIEDSRKVALVTGIGGGVLLVGGVVMFFAFRGGKDDRGATSGLRLAPTKDHGFEAVLRF